jgi:DNA polymerase-3 subunit delta'
MPFRDVVGHGRLLRLIARAVSRDTLPPSLLFTGPDGVGKLLVAVALAQAQNCLAVTKTPPFAVDACGECSACGKIFRRSFADVLLVEPGENGSIAIDQIRHAVSQSAYRPFEGRRRVVIIRDADHLLSPAQNALLKTLEEPSDASQFILVTSRPDLLLATVRSRTQRLIFGQLTVSEVVDVVGREGFDPSAVQVAAAAAGGSAGRALALVSGELVAARDAAVGVLRNVSTARDARARIDAAKEFVGKSRAGAAARQDLTRRLSALTSLLRDVELLAAGSTQGLANADVRDGLKTLSRTYGGARGVKAFASVGTAQDAVERNVSPKVVADWLACRL